MQLYGNKRMETFPDSKVHGDNMAPWTLLSGLLIQVKVCKMTILDELIVLFVSYSRGLFK